GGSEGEIGRAIAIDAAGKAYVTGSTLSANFPVKNALQPTYGGTGNLFDDGGGAFVVRLAPHGTALASSTYLGGSSDDFGRSIALDAFGNMYVAGQTFSTDFPTANGLQGANGGGADAFVAKILGRLTQFEITAPATVTAGVAFSITVKVI